MAVILDIRSERILDIFDLQITPMLRTKFQVNCSSVQKKKRQKKKKKKIDFQDGGHGGYLGFSIETILARFD